MILGKHYSIFHNGIITMISLSVLFGNFSQCTSKQNEQGLVAQQEQLFFHNDMELLAGPFKQSEIFNADYAIVGYTNSQCGSCIQDLEKLREFHSKMRNNGILVDLVILMRGDSRAFAEYALKEMMEMDGKEQIYYDSKGVFIEENKLGSVENKDRIFLIDRDFRILLSGAAIYKEEISIDLLEKLL